MQNQMHTFQKTKPHFRIVIVFEWIFIIFVCKNFPEDQDPVPELLAAVDQDIERSRERDRVLEAERVAREVVSKNKFYTIKIKSKPIKLKYNK